MTAGVFGQRRGAEVGDRAFGRAYFVCQVPHVTPKFTSVPLDSAFLLDRAVAPYPTKKEHRTPSEREEASVWRSRA